MGGMVSKFRRGRGGEGGTASAPSSRSGTLERDQNAENGGQKEDVKVSGTGTWPRFMKKKDPGSKSAGTLPKNKKEEGTEDGVIQENQEGEIKAEAVDTTNAEPGASPSKQNKENFFAKLLRRSTKGKKPKKDKVADATKDGQTTEGGDQQANGDAGEVKEDAITVSVAATDQSAPPDDHSPGSTQALDEPSPTSEDKPAPAEGASENTDALHISEPDLSDKPQEESTEKSNELFIEEKSDAPATEQAPTVESEVVAEVAKTEESTLVEEVLQSVQTTEVNSEPQTDVSAEPVVEAASEPVVEAASEPAVEALSEPVVEATSEPVVEARPEPLVEATPEPIVETTPVPVVEATPEPVVDATPEPVVEAASEPVVEAAPEPVVETTHEPIVQATQEAAVEPEVEAAPEPVVDVTQEAAAEPVVESAPVPVVEVTHEAVSEDVKEETEQPAEVSQELAVEDVVASEEAASTETVPTVTDGAADEATPEAASDPTPETTQPEETTTPQVEVDPPADEASAASTDAPVEPVPEDNQSTSPAAVEDTSSDPVVETSGAADVEQVPESSVTHAEESSVAVETPVESQAVEPVVDDLNRRVATEFVWEHGGAKVAVSGSFNDWNSVPLEEKPTCVNLKVAYEFHNGKRLSDGAFKVTLDIPEGPHKYKYNVDGEETANPSEAMEDGLNVIDVHRQ